MIRREVAISKQLIREAHESFQTDMVRQFNDILKRVSSSFTPLQIKRAQLAKTKEDLLATVRKFSGDLGETEDMISNIHQDMVRRRVKPSGMFVCVCIYVLVYTPVVAGVKFFS